MNYLTKTLAVLIFITFTFFEFNAKAQIQDIKKNSKENKTNNSANNSSNSNSSNSGSNDSEFTSGCISSLFNIFTGCLSSLPEKDNNNNYNHNNPDDFIVIIPDDQNIKTNNQNSNNAVNNRFDDTTRFKPKLPQEFSLDLNANFALGYQYGSDSSYSYYMFLPQIRVNLAWFLIDYRFNMLTQISDNLPDAFKTWDLEFLFKINADADTKIIFGTGMHHEEYTGMTYNEHFLGAKIGLFDNRDFLDINGRLAMDYTTKEYPFSEVTINYNRCIINAKNMNGYISIGGLYQNYYSSVDIWGLRAGITINWHN